MKKDKKGLLNLTAEQIYSYTIDDLNENLMKVIKKAIKNKE